MKKCFAIAALSLASMAPVSTTFDHQFSNDDLNGSYAFSFTGEALAGPLVGPLGGVGLIEVDGDGNIVSATRTINLGGLALQNETGTGFYSVSADGTGSMTIVPDDPAAPPATSDFVLISNHEMIFVNTDPGFVVNGTARKQKP